MLQCHDVLGWEIMTALRPRHARVIMLEGHDTLGGIMLQGHDVLGREIMTALRPRHARVITPALRP